MSVGEVVGSAQEGEAGSEQVGLERRRPAIGFSALEFASYEGESFGEPSDYVEAVEDVAGVGQVLVDGGLIGLGSVGDDDLHTPAPAGPLITKEPAQRPFRTSRDHRQHLFGIPTRDHGHIPVMTPDRRFIHQQHPTAPDPTPLGDPSRMGFHQRHDPMPPHPVTARQRPNRHHCGVLHQPANKPAGKAALEPVMVLDVPPPTVPTHEPPAPPEQHRAAAAHLQIPDPLHPPIPHPIAFETALRAPRPTPR